MTLTEQIPDNLPDWGIKAMAEERFFEVAVAKVKSLEAENKALKSAGMKLKVSARRVSQVLSDTELSPPGKLKKLLQHIGQAVEEDRIRIKPKTITLYEYSPILSGVPEDLHWTEDQHRISFDYTGRIIRDAVITDE